MSFPDTQPDDLQAWLLLKQGNEDAFSLLFERYHATLYNYGMKLAPAHPDLVEDAVQDLFVDLWRLRGGLTDKVESVRFYLYRSLRRKISLARKRASAPELEETDPEYALLAEGSHESRIIREESIALRNRRLEELTGQLPERQLEALTLKYFENFSTQEIAGIMEVNEKSVRNFLYKALTALRKHKDQLSALGNTLPAIGALAGLL